MKRRIYWTLAVLVLVGGTWGTIQILESMEDETVIKVRKVIGDDVAGPSAGAIDNRRGTRTDSNSRRAPDAADQEQRRQTQTARRQPARQSGHSSGEDRSDPATAFAPGEILVVAPPDGFRKDILRLGFVVLEETLLEAIDLTMMRLRVPRGRDESEALRLLNGEFPGITADLNHYYIPSQDQSPRTSERRRTKIRTAKDAIRKARTKRDTIPSRARQVIGWNDLPATCGRGVTIGMIDSRVDLDHPALSGKDILVRNVHSRRLASAPPNHGTSIAALLVGKPGDKGWGGLVPGASLRVANIFAVNADGDTVGAPASVLRGINWLARQGVQVVSIGLTGPNNKSVRKAMAQAQKKNLILIAAVGNRGLKRKRAYPAGFYHVIGVTAIGPYKGVMKNANLGDYVDFAAPGVRLWTAVPGGGRYQSGSSFAAAYVAAVAATKIANGLDRDPDAVRTELQKQVEDLGKPGRDDLYGWGLIRSRPDC